MSDAREQILGAIRRSLRRNGPLETSVREALAARTRAHRVHVQPAVPESDLAERFERKLAAADGTAQRVRGTHAVAPAVRDYLQNRGLESRLVLAADDVLADIEWPPELAIERRAAKADDAVSVTGAFCAVAETGTVVLLSGPASPTTLNFLPEDHIVVFPTIRIVRHIEDAWARLRAEHESVPRVVNFVTGPSRTADVEQTLQVGAHGPRRLHVILVEG